jgi:hypothetical protein
MSTVQSSLSSSFFQRQVLALALGSSLSNAIYSVVEMLVKVLTLLAKSGACEVRKVRLLLLHGNWIVRRITHPKMVGAHLCVGLFLTKPSLGSYSRS